jgi:hypothetical protein
MNRGTYIAIECDGEVEVHANSIWGNYATLCDGFVGQCPAALDIGARIDCDACIAIIRFAKQFREKDFVAGKREKRR